MFYAAVLYINGDTMKQSKLLGFFRMIFSLAGVICLCLALSFLARQLHPESKFNSERDGFADVKYNVLFLSSYDSMYYTFDDQKNGIQDVLYKHGIEFDVTYMDTKRYAGPRHLRGFYEFFKERYNYNEFNYDAIIIGDDQALQFALDHQNELFADIPIVFLGINNYERAVTGESNPNMTGFFEISFLEKTMSDAIKALPDNKHLVIIHDSSEAGLVDMSNFYVFGSNYPDYTLEDIDTEAYTKDDIVGKIKHIPDDSIIFFTSGYNDLSGHKYSLLDMSNIILHNCNAPVFRNYEGAREFGILGGTYMDMKAQAMAAAARVCEILEDGKTPSDFELSLDTPYTSLYNYNVMQRYGLTESDIPLDSKFILKPESLAEIYKGMLPVAVLMLASMLSFIASVSFALANEKIHVKALEVSKAETEKSREQLKYQAEHDELLDILNRRAIVTYLHDNFKSMPKFAIILLDIDGFKYVNENYGHSIGDLILNDITDKLKSYSSTRNLVLGRYGGDEFILLCPYQWLNVDSQVVLDLVDLFSTPFIAGTVDIMLSVSVGISNSYLNVNVYDHIINSEIALYESKERGKNIISVYTEEMKNKLTDETNIKNAFLHAFENNDFYMKYQPKVSTESLEVCGYEALIRIKDSPYGPGQFIPVVEKTGWTTRLGRLITELVVKQLAEWKAEGKKIYPVSINYSSRQVNDTGYCEYLRALLEKYDIDPKYIEIEITESLLIEETLITKKLFSDFQELGVKLLLDDFGTGYSSLAYLTYVPFDNVKLDKSLVDTYLVEGKESFIRDVIQLIHDIGKTITIEGVEHEWQLEKLTEYNADIIQGYYFSKPLDPEDAIEFKAK